jgi:hypothetical protein
MSKVYGWHFLMPSGVLRDRATRALAAAKGERNG